MSHPVGQRRVRIAWELAALFFVVGAAAFLRMGYPGVVEFKRDEAALSLVALDFLRTGNLPLLGIVSSVGIPNAPFNAYIMAIPYAFSSSPIVATQFIGLMNVGAVALAYGFLRRYTGLFPALLAGFAFAVSPWAVIFSRKIWAQDMLPLFIMAVLVSGIYGFVHGRRWGQMAFLPLLVITGQIHYGAFVIGPVVVYLLWHGRHYLTRAFWWSILLAGLPLVPYALGLIRADLFNLDVLRNALGGSEGADGGVQGGLFSTQVLRDTLLLFSGDGMHSLAGPGRFTDFLDRVPDVYPLFYLVAFWILLSVVWLTYRGVAADDKRRTLDQVLVIGIVFPIVIYTVNWTPFYIHYLIPIIPLGFIAGGLALHDVQRFITQQGRAVRYILTYSVTIVVIIVFALQTALTLQLLDFLKSEHTPGGFGVPAQYLIQMKEAVREQGNEGIIVYDTDHMLPAEVWEVVFVESHGQLRQTQENIQIYPQGDAAILQTGCTDEDTQYMTFRSPDEGCYTIDTYIPGNAKLQNHINESLSADFNNGVEMLGYRWDDNRCITLAWEITNAAASADYMFSIHAFNQNGTRIGIADDLSWPGKYWIDGDRLVKDFCFSTNMEQPDTIDVGMYRLINETVHTVTLEDDQNVITIRP